MNERQVQTCLSNDERDRVVYMTTEIRSRAPHLFAKFILKKRAPELRLGAQWRCVMVRAIARNLEAEFPEEMKLRTAYILGIYSLNVPRLFCILGHALNCARTGKETSP
jgi:hypothetical protein